MHVSVTLNMSDKEFEEDFLCTTKNPYHILAEADILMDILLYARDDGLLHRVNRCLDVASIHPNTSRYQLEGYYRRLSYLYEDHGFKTEANIAKQKSLAQNIKPSIKTVPSETAGSDIDFPSFEPDKGMSEEIRDLLWFIDGPNKNVDEEVSSLNFRGLTFNIMDNRVGEPSAISLKLPVASSVNPNIEAPGYYPSYSTLSPEQRRIYLYYLADPFNTDFNVGYVYLFYYGLERHLYTSKEDKAFSMILKLVKVHDISYAYDALMFASLTQNRKDWARQVLRSLPHSLGHYTESINTL